MKNFIKENLVLVVGLTLPLLLIVLFIVATVIPKALGTPPQYEMLYTITKRYDYQDPPGYIMDFAVKNNKLVVKATKNNNKNRIRANVLMAYDGKTETIREIDIDAAKAAKGGGEVVLQETSHMTIDMSKVSPDGYVLESPGYRSGGLVGGIFGGSYHNSGYMLKKGSVGYKIPNTPGTYYYNQVKFIGWVINK